MLSAKLPEERITELANWVAGYISEQRAFFVGSSQPIGSVHMERLQAFFPKSVLGQVRVARGRASEPLFYSQLKAMGIRNAPAFWQMAGITFVDVVVHVDVLTPSLLFHELVHAVQYQQLGLKGFAESYVRGFLTGGSYENIPLEKQAYELEARFSARRALVFSVEDDVKQRIRTTQL